MAARLSPTKARFDGDDDDDDDEGDEPCEPKGNGKGKGAGSMLGDKLLKGRVILVTKPVDRELMSAIVAQLLVMDAESQEPITMYINCPGGDADSGFGIYDAMRFVRSPITTVCMGLAASAAIIIFLGGRKGRRFALPHCRFLIHQPSSQAQGQASDLEITANEIIKTRDKYNGIIASETGRAAKDVVRDAHRDFWLSAEEAVTYKLADRIVTGLAELNGRA